MLGTELLSPGWVPQALLSRGSRITEVSLGP